MEMSEALSAPTLSQFYGLTAEGRIVLLPLAPHAAAALKQMQHEADEKGALVPAMSMIFNDHQYRSIISAVDAELEDTDGDGRIPTYLVVPFATQLPVFPHASVDTDEEVREFIESYPMVLAGPVRLTDVRDHWPRPVDQIEHTPPASEESSEEQ